MSAVTYEPTSVGVLQSMALLVASGWTQGAYARNALGHSCDPAEPGACEFCISGARMLAIQWAEVASSPLRREVRSALSQAAGSPRIAEVNDDELTTREGAVALIARAAEHAASHYYDLEPRP